MISTRAQQPANDPNAQLRIFESVLQHIQNDYVDEPNMDRFVPALYAGLAYVLIPIQPISRPSRFGSNNENGKDNQVGIGAELSQVAFLSICNRSDERLTRRSGRSKSW